MPMGMKYEDFKRDVAYRVVSGRNDNLKEGDLFWIESKSGALILDGGWLEHDEIPDDIFDGLEIKRAYEYVTIKNEGGTARIVHESMIQSRWIEITPEMMPPEFEFVLVAVLMNKSKDYGIPWVAHILDGEWVTADGTRIEKEFGLTVTHWMPLPEPAED